MLDPRLLTLAQARQYLGGKHPALIGAKPIGRLWDKREIDHLLDVRAGIEIQFETPRTGPAADDCAEGTELDSLAAKIAAHAPRRI